MPRRYIQHGEAQHLKACDVDWALLARDLYATCRERDVTLRSVEEAIGISATQLGRLRRGEPLSAAGLASLVAWLYPTEVPHWVITPERRRKLREW